MDENVTRRQALAGVTTAAGAYLVAGTASASPAEATPMRFVEASLSFDPASEASGDWSYQTFDVDYMSNPTVDPVNELVTIPEAGRAQAQGAVTQNGSLVYQGGQYSNTAARFGYSGESCLPTDDGVVSAASLSESVEADVVVTGQQTTVETAGGRTELQAGERRVFELDAVTAELAVQRATDRLATDSLPERRAALEVENSTETVTVRPTLTVVDRGEMDVRIGR